MEVAEDGRIHCAAEGVLIQARAQRAVVKAVEIGETTAEDDGVRVEDVDEDGEGAGDAVEEAVERGDSDWVAFVGGGDDLVAAEGLAGDGEEVALEAGT